MERARSRDGRRCETPRLPNLKLVPCRTGTPDFGKVFRRILLVWRIRVPCLAFPRTDNESARWIVRPVEQPCPHFRCEARRLRSADAPIRGDRSSGRREPERGEVSYDPHRLAARRVELVLANRSRSPWLVRQLDHIRDTERNY